MRKLAALLFLLLLACPCAVSAAPALEQGGRLNYDETPTPATSRSLGEASPLGWTLSLVGICTLGGLVWWAVRRKPPREPQP